MPEVVLEVEHHGQYKMVGKVFRSRGRDVFLHEESGNQQHHKFEAPGGIDTLVLDWLAGAGVEEVHHRNRDTGVLWAVDRETYRRDGIFANYDGRERLYLPYGFWTEIPGDYEVPWVTTIKRLGEPVAQRPLYTAAEVSSLPRCACPGCPSRSPGGWCNCGSFWLDRERRPHCGLHDPRLDALNRPPAPPKAAGKTKTKPPAPSPERNPEEKPR